MLVWRLVDRAFVAEAWTGAGARIHGGRWNEPGMDVVYCSEQPALAILEKMAGGLRASDLKHWVLLCAEVPDDAVVALPQGKTEREQGAAWWGSKALACRVPSRVVAGNNILLNPRSPRWAEVKVLGESPIDARLWSP